MDSSVIIEALGTAGPPGRYGWAPLSRDGSTLSATCTLAPDGSAAFDATATADRPGGAWVIWHVDLLDRDGFIIGSLARESPVDGDWRKFVLPMPRPWARYRAQARATFDAELWAALERLKLYASLATPVR